MRTVSNVAAAASALLLAILALPVTPALAASTKGTADCEQMTNPVLKISACTRILQSGKPADDAKASAYHHRGVGYLLQQNFDRAIVEFNEALRIDPAYKRSLNSRGNAWKGKGETGLALADYNAAIKVDPGFSFPYNGRAGVWYSRGEWDRAIDDYSEVIRLDPGLAAPYANRGNAWKAKGDLDRAMEDQNEALRRDPKNVVVYANRGEIWRLKGDLERALMEQDQSVRLDPKSPLPYVARGNTYRYKGELNRALADYDQALRLTPDYIPAFVGRGLTFEKAGDVARARAEYSKALNSKSQFRGDNAGSALETARARLAAFDSGAVQPVIPAAPARVTSSTSIPTPEVAVPAPAKVEPGKLGRRVALVIGNAGYANASRLKNPQHDANVVAASLRAIGFETVTVANDATRGQMIDALRTFSGETAKADWAVVYYSGHGMEVSGTNYLLPVDFKLAQDAVPLDQVMAAAQGARKLRLILLDACRNNPFTSPARPNTSSRATVAMGSNTLGSTAVGLVGERSTGGLGAVKVSGATLVVYAAKHGQTALDGQGNNSPFAIAMVQRLATPNVEINKLFRLVRDDVMEATAGRQEPYTYGSLPGREDFFFVQN
jgi:tetratricopeptide (TPR) repeat protein